MSKPYLHLDLEERRKIARWHEAKIPATEIAARLGRHRSTIFRELKRNRFVNAELRYLTGYYALNAQNLAAERHANQRKLIQQSASDAAAVYGDHNIPRFAEELPTRHRPAEVTERSNFGDWEADLIQFRKEFGATNLTSLIERVSRFTMLLKNSDRRAVGDAMGGDRLAQAGLGSATGPRGLIYL